MSTAYPASVATWPSEGVTLMIILLILLALAAAILRLRGAKSRSPSTDESGEENVAPRLNPPVGVTDDAEKRDI